MSYGGMCCIVGGKCPFSILIMALRRVASVYGG